MKPHGTHTAANSSYLTDGASAVLIMEETRAKSLGFTPKTVLKDFVFVSQDPREQLLLGPAYAIAKLLTRHNLKPTDVGVWELHEAFAGQVLANLKALDSESFARENMKLSSKIGEVWDFGLPVGSSAVRSMCPFTVADGQAEHFGWFSVDWTPVRCHRRSVSHNGIKSYGA